MESELLRTFFRSGIFLVGLSLVLIIAVPRDSAEFVVSFCTLAIGLTLLGLIVLVNRLTR